MLPSPPAPRRASVHSIIVALIIAVAAPVAAEASRGFADVYNFETYYGRFNNLVGYLQTKGGLELEGTSPIRWYAILRATRDTLSRAGTTPAIYADNFGVLATGVSVSPFSIGLMLFAEAGFAVPLMGTVEQT